MSKLRPGDMKGLFQGCVAWWWHCFNFTQVFWISVEHIFQSTVSVDLGRGQERKDKDRRRVHFLWTGLYYDVMKSIAFGVRRSRGLASVPVFCPCFDVLEKLFYVLASFSSQMKTVFSVLCIWPIFVFCLFTFLRGNEPLNFLFYKMKFL